MNDRGRKAIDDQIAYYRARAPEYDEEFQGAHVAGLVTALAAARPAGRVLELACGTGAWTQSLLTHPIKSVLCIDAAPEMLDLHAQRIRDPRVTRLAADIFAWRPLSTYDFVTFAFWLSHVPPAQFEAFWEVVRKAIAPGGMTFFADQDRRGLEFEQPSEDDDYPIVRRTLQDGTVMSAIKVYHEPEALAERLQRLGWEASVGAVEDGVFWGVAFPR